MSQLAQLTCPACAAPARLVDADETRCEHCAAAVVIPAVYRQALTDARALEAARARAEPLWTALSAPPPTWVGLAAWLMVLVLPVVATLVASLVPHPPLARIEIYAAVTLPALAPGLALAAWFGLVAATAMRYRDAMRPRPARGEGGAPRCRTCSAELAIDPGAVAVTCAYCGTDNLADPGHRYAMQASLRSSVRTLADATRRLRTRRIGFGLALVSLVVAIGGASSLLWLALV